MTRNNVPELVAGGNVYPCRFIQMNDAYEGVQGGDNTVCIGVSGEGTLEPPIPQQATAYHATDGDPLTQMSGLGDVCLLTAGTGGFSAGDRLKSDANGAGVPIASTGTTNQNVSAIAIDDAAEGEQGRVQVRFETVRPALA